MLPPGGLVQPYDPEIAPDRAAWLALDEQERLELAETYHRQTRIQLPNAKAHAIFHAIVENQIAMGLDSVVRAMARLKAGGLTRHDAIHAIGSVLAEHVHEIFTEEVGDSANVSQSRYHAAVERLSASEWLRMYGPE